MCEREETTLDCQPNGFGSTVPSSIQIPTLCPTHFYLFFVIRYSFFSHDILFVQLQRLIFWEYRVYLRVVFLKWWIYIYTSLYFKKLLDFFNHYINVKYQSAASNLHRTEPNWPLLIWSPCLYVFSILKTRTWDIIKRIQIQFDSESQ